MLKIFELWSREERVLDTTKCEAHSPARETLVTWGLSSGHLDVQNSAQECLSDVVWPPLQGNLDLLEQQEHMEANNGRRRKSSWGSSSTSGRQNRKLGLSLKWTPIISKEALAQWLTPCPQAPLGLPKNRVYLKNEQRMPYMVPTGLLSRIAPSSDELEEVSLEAGRSLSGFSTLSPFKSFCGSMQESYLSSPNFQKDGLFLLYL
ncbi:hypothetical protein VNO77_20179 [Canavalia gladiata]|uniref:Uncharacterized protein n=1 Tax=Canavalia gladiata TaxID=3824 RepID=A0AAN9LSQ9_CANGL